MSDVSAVVIPIVVGIGSLLAGVIGTTVKATWTIAAIKTQFTADIAGVRIEIRTEHEESMRAFGETVSAIRQKVGETELWNRDNFVRRDDFATVMEAFNRALDSLRIEIKADISKLDGKIDKLSWAKLTAADKG